MTGEELAVFYPRGHSKHYFPGHPERPERVEEIRRALEEEGIWQQAKKLQPLDLKRELLESIHTEAYLLRLEKASSSSQSLDLDTYTTEESWQLALDAAGGAAETCRSVWRGEASRGFSLSRPPGHHATSDRGMGFCLLNNAALAAEYLLQQEGAGRLAIVDLDLHHGNGTQDIFFQRGDVSYCSIHQSPFYPGTGSLQERGKGLGRGKTLNIPLQAGAGDTAYQTLTDEILLPFLDQQRPEMVLVSYGFDIHWRDPLGGMQVSAAGYHRMIGSLTRWAEQHTGGRIVLILEGGYDLKAAGACSLGAVLALLGEDFQDPLGPSPGEETQQWRAVLNRAESLLQM